ncbi:copper resistance CopC family protein [Nocardioides currus]|nr:copper resistance protein CopC [Nocardioides currus]
MVASTSVPASAHTDLVSSSPAAEAVLPAPPRAIELTFSEEVDPDFVTVIATVDDDAAGPRRLALVTDEPAPTITADIPPLPTVAGDTRWRVDYRVTSVDGHPIQGTIRFTVQAAGRSTPSDAFTPEATPPTPASSQPAQVDDGPDATESLGHWIRVLFALGLLLLAVPVVLVVVRRVRAEEQASNSTSDHP